MQAFSITRWYGLPAPPPKIKCYFHLWSCSPLLLPYQLPPFGLPASIGRTRLATAVTVFLVLSHSVRKDGTRSLKDHECDIKFRRIRTIPFIGRTDFFGDLWCSQSLSTGAARSRGLAAQFKRQIKKGLTQH